ncbi:MAG: hypothetical protein M3477_09120 [Gemmatimonadota bacterium]|nr:hypothetical protein [Gemmatimonadota bacterium]
MPRTTPGDPLAARPVVPLTDDSGGNDWLVNAPPKNPSWRTWKPTVLGLGPGTISIVVGVKGTAVLNEPRVATAAQVVTLRLNAALNLPVALLAEVMELVPLKSRVNVYFCRGPDEEAWHRTQGSRRRMRAFTSSQVDLAPGSPSKSASRSSASTPVLIGRGVGPL